MPMKKNNVIIFEDNPLYIKKLVKDKPLNLFGAPIPTDTIVKNFRIFRRIIKSYK
jgi:hypothetical protein